MRNRRWRHPFEKGDPAQRQVGAALRCLLKNSTWKRHPAPFAKTNRGFYRRSERYFVEYQKRAFVGA